MERRWHRSVTEYVRPPVELIGFLSPGGGNVPEGQRGRTGLTTPLYPKRSVISTGNVGYIGFVKDNQGLRHPTILGNLSLNQNLGAPMCLVWATN